MKLAYHTVVGEGRRWCPKTRILSAVDRTPLRGVAVKLATKRSSLHSVPQQLFAPNFRASRAAIDGVTSVRPSSSLEPFSKACFSLAQHFQSRPCLKQPVILLLKPLQPHPAAPTRSPKQAGMEITLRTVSIEHPLLYGSCLHSPPAEEGSKPFISPETAVQADGTEVHRFVLDSIPRSSRTEEVAC